MQTREPLAVHRYRAAGFSRNDLGMSEANIVVFRRARLRDAIAAHALRAVPLGLAAFVQAPSRWGEWLRDAAGR